MRDEKKLINRRGNKIVKTEKKKKLTASEERKKKSVSRVRYIPVLLLIHNRKDRMARRKRGEEVFTDEE